ncbi:helix-hairpin-helix domain-containing protein [Mucilaginibacter lacusdianchii]|uniref:helix-hairpin-helix domain-containing protein n=1 Tax=Mucilaginibacter lacusdianchii TaxID=2684211 RepID=UPI003F72A000
MPSISGMENKPIARTLKLLSQLMELHEVNPFKIKSVANAAFKIDKLPYPLAGKSIEQLNQIDGIGKSISGYINELLQTGTITDLEDLLKTTPPGVVEMLSIKGIGPKKIATIWHQLGIENVGELYYACNENRLAEAKGFGLKTQEEVKRILEFRMANSGKVLYAQAQTEAEELLQAIKSVLPNSLSDFAGEYRRRCEVIHYLAIIVGVDHPADAMQKIATLALLNNATIESDKVTGNIASGLLVSVIVTGKSKYFYTLFKQTGNEEHVQAVLKQIGTSADEFGNEQAIYQAAGMDWITPELREGLDYIEKATNHNLPLLIELQDLKGSLHNHSTWSDGINTLEEMALYCRDKMHLEYLGICDHSKSAFYAKGLSIERVLQQHEEIDRLNQQLNGFHIFKGIESDILSDGSLDYPDEILEKFDFIVASVHSNLKMDEEKATTRLIRAIENPYTTILGHPTGRLLLSRKGYDIDYKKVIDACAANNVVIEINANPLRLDLDWRWCQYAIDRGVWLSINPDAHRTNGFHDIEYGLLAARKGGLTKEMCLNALSLPQIKEKFELKKSKASY